MHQVISSETFIIPSQFWRNFARQIWAEIGVPSLNLGKSLKEGNWFEEGARLRIDERDKWEI